MDHNCKGYWVDLALNVRAILPRISCVALGFEITIWWYHNITCVRTSTLASSENMVLWISPQCVCGIFKPIPRSYSGKEKGMLGLSRHNLCIALKLLIHLKPFTTGRHMQYTILLPSKILTGCQLRADLMVLPSDSLTTWLPLYCRHQIPSL